MGTKNIGAKDYVRAGTLIMMLELDLGDSMSTVKGRSLRLVTRKRANRTFTDNAPRKVAVLALPGTALSDIAAPYETFLLAARLGKDRLALPLPFYDVSLLSIAGDSIKTLSGLSVTGAFPFSSYQEIPDTLIVAGEADSLNANSNYSALFNWIRLVREGSRRVCSVCTGIFCLAAAGVLRGKHVTTHWQHAKALAHDFPDLFVDPEPLFLRDDKFYTSAGCTAGMDLSLALIEEDLGSEIASEIARDSIMFVRRSGRQGQISPLLKLQMSDREPMRELQTWMLEHLNLPLTVEDLASQVHMSPRNFARCFVTEVGTTPARFLETLRLEAARRRLEETNRNVDQIAAECGFGSAEVMRRSFLRNLGTSPNSYRVQSDAGG